MSPELKAVLGVLERGIRALTGNEQFELYRKVQAHCGTKMERMINDRMRELCSKEHESDRMAQGASPGLSAAQEGTAVDPTPGVRGQ